MELISQLSNNGGQGSTVPIRTFKLVNYYHKIQEGTVKSCLLVKNVQLRTYLSYKRAVLSVDKS